MRVCENRGKVEFGVGGKNWLPCYVTPERFVSLIGTSYSLTCACKKAVGGFIGSGMGIRSAILDTGPNQADQTRSVQPLCQQRPTKGSMDRSGCMAIGGGVPHGVHARAGDSLHLAHAHEFGAIPLGHTEPSVQRSKP